MVELRRRRKPLRRLLALSLSIIAGVALISCGGSGNGSDTYGESNPVSVQGDSVTVEMKDIRFDPKGIKVKPGTTVTWVNNDPVVHNVRQVQSVFLSEDVMDPGALSTFTFGEPGTYRYVCTLHEPNMNGVVIVREE
jgi:plastocyanin